MRIILTIVAIQLLVLAMLIGCSRYRVEQMPASGISEPPVARSGSDVVEPTLPPHYEIPVRRSSPRSPRIEMPIINELPTTSELPIGEASLGNSSVAISSIRTSIYETYYDSSDAGRCTNISLAASSINNTIVQPGEIFSFNNTIGSTTGERGYQKSVIFVNGKKAKGFGGGVCQVSTTLCNAAAQAGMTILERHDHSLPVEYVRDGLQAATSHNAKLDFRFQNDTNRPVIIRAASGNGTVSVSLCEM